ncbi:cystatin-like protein [Drosophila obscura]|uniref:cystatin-like protein n=1 Tax=Drosophila obscura TaxID=7282 RepID=UPI001BB0FD8F|nr:cystatin-like protein [Drosophila obscura]
MNGIILLSLLALCCAALGSSDDLGAPVILTSEARQKAIELLDATLAQLSTGDGPSYKPISVGIVTSQIVTGTLYTYNDVELETGSEKKRCTVKIWSRPWLKENSTKVVINCLLGDGNDEVDRTF